MRLIDVCYVLLTVTITATYAHGENLKETEKGLSEKRADRRLSKRDAALLIDSYPVESYTQPKTIYRRVSKIRYRSPKPKYGPPKNKYGPPRHYLPKKQTRVPVKKYRGKKYTPKYGPPPKTRRPKPKYGVPKKPHKPVYGPPKVPTQQPYYTNEPTGFGEPPAEYPNDFAVKPTHNDPLVDSYGAPLQAANKHYPTRQPYPGATNTYNNAFDIDHEFESFQNYHQDQNLDNTYAFSKKHPTFVKPDLGFVGNEDMGLHTYSDVFKYEHDFKEFPVKEKNAKPYSGHKDVNRPWKKTPEDDDEDQILVGGQYAEPPARYVPKFQPSAPMYSGVEDFSPIGSLNLDAPSATISPYVNYKNSNMAFSPQNLNDAFSISR